MKTTVTSEPNSATKMNAQNNKTKRSISRANDPKVQSPQAIYTMHVTSIENPRRTSTKGKVMNPIGRKVINKTIEIVGDHENRQAAIMSPQNVG